MDIGRVLKDSWAIFVKDWGALIVASLITFVLSIVTLGLLSVALSAGLYRMILGRVREGRKAAVGDVFACFDRLGSYIVAYLLILVIGLAFAVVVGLPLVLLVINNSGARAFGLFLFALAALAAAVVGVYLATVWVFWTLLMVDRRRSVTEAFGESRALVMKSGFWMTLLLVIIVGAIAGAVSSTLSAFTLGIGGFLSFLLVPWEFAAYTSMYLQAAGEGALLPSAFPGPSSAWQGGGAFTGGLPPGYPPAYGPPGYVPPPGCGPPPPGYDPQSPPPPGYPPPPPGYAPSPAYDAASPPGYAPPGYPAPPAVQAPPWMTPPTTPPPWVQQPVPAAQAPAASPPEPTAYTPAPDASPPGQGTPPPDVSDSPGPAPPAPLPPAAPTPPEPPA
jgi:hypothetical protein